MPYELQIFRDESQREFRTVEINGLPWFYGIDICNALDIKNPSDAYARLDTDDLGQTEGIDGRGRRQTFTIVNESGLYSLILRSDKPEAKRFKKWITSQVLPAIRKTGTYSTAAPQPGLEWKPFHDRLNLALAPVPDGFFSIFREMADLTAQLIVQGAVVDDATIPDISVGKMWSIEWTAKGYEQEFGARTSYEHHYPAYFRQAKANPQWPACYPEDALPTFRRWFRYVYLPENFPQYLKRKVSKGEIPAGIAQGVLKAVAASAPKQIR